MKSLQQLTDEEQLEFIRELGDSIEKQINGDDTFVLAIHSVGGEVQFISNTTKGMTPNILRVLAKEIDRQLSEGN